MARRGIRFVDKNKIVGIFIVMCLSACGGGGGGGKENPPVQTTSSTPATTSSSSSASSSSSSSALPVNISGNVSYDHVPVGNHNGLDFANVESRPSRGLVVEALDSQNTVVAASQTDASGNYSINVPGHTTLKIRVKAEMQNNSAATWNVKVTDNTKSYSTYAMEGQLVDSGSTDSVRNLHASYKLLYYHGTEDRAAAPFNIIDVVYGLFSRMANEGAINNFPSLELRWSSKNRSVNGDETLGEIGGTAYHPDKRTIYISGNATTDMHEFDTHVLAHETGHYITYALFRGMAAIGAGSHNELNVNDIRPAYDEGIATAYAGILLNDPDWREVAFVNGTPSSTYHGGPIDCANCYPNNGAFSEGSTYYLVYSYFNMTQSQFVKPLESFFKIFSDQGYMKSDAFPSIYLFAAQVERLYPNAYSTLEPMLNAKNIFGRGDFGEGETFDKGFPYLLPHYTIINAGQGPVQICTSSHFYTQAGYVGSYGLHRLLLLKVASAGSYSVSVTKSGGAANPVSPYLSIFQSAQYNYWMSSNIANGVLLNSWNNLPPYFKAANYVFDLQGDNTTSFIGKDIKSCFDVSVSSL